MRAWTALLGVGLAVGAGRADDVSWTAGIPLWKGLSPAGQVVEAGPAPAWDNPQSRLEPAARLGKLIPAPIRPQELPDGLDPAPKPTPLPFPRVVGYLPTTEAPQPFGKDVLAPALTPAGGAADTLLPPVRSVYRPVDR